MSRSPYSSVFLSLAPSFPSHSLCLSEVRNLFSARELLHRFCPPVAVFKCALLWGGAQSDAGLFSFLWLKLVSLALFLCLSVSLSPSLCHSGRPVQRQKHNDCVESKQPPPHPILQCSLLSVSEQSGEERSIAQQPRWWWFHSVWILFLSKEWGRTLVNVKLCVFHFNRLPWVCACGCMCVCERESYGCCLCHSVGFVSSCVVSQI